MIGFFSGENRERDSLDHQQAGKRNEVGYDSLVVVHESLASSKAFEQVH